MSYEIMNDKVIYNSHQCNVTEQGFIYEKAYPSEALKPIIFHAIDDSDNIEDHIKTIVHDFGTQGIPDDQLFTINLKDITVGNYFFAGLIYNSMNKSDEFIKDLKTGHIQLALINLDKSFKGRIGILILDLLHICREIQTPVIHVFVPDMIAKQILSEINEQLGDKYFIKYGNEVFNE